RCLPPTVVPYTLRALRHRDLRLFLVCQLLSLVVLFLHTLAHTVLYSLSLHAALPIWTAWFCSGIAVFFLGPLGGLAADRYPRHRAVDHTPSLSSLRAFVRPPLPLSERVAVSHVLALAAFLGVIAFVMTTTILGSLVGA